MPYAPLNGEPYPPGASWFVVVWIDEADDWVPTRPNVDRGAAVKALNEMREKNPDHIYRLIRENRFYTTEED